MKTALLLALLGACVAVSYGSYGCYEGYGYECVKDDYKKCTAVKVCENVKKEKCGYDYCGYGYVCASEKKKICKDFLKLKELCESKKVCKEVKKPCGYDYCGYDEECVKEKVCKVKHGYGRRLMQHEGYGYDAEADADSKAYAEHDARADAKAVAEGHSAKASASSTAIAGKRFGKKFFEKCDYCKKDEKLECFDAYSCVKKEPCKEVVVKKCVKDVLRPGYDVCHGGYEFDWDAGYAHGDYCGDEYCDYGYKCADVYYQKCSTPCGHDYCGYGYECVVDEPDCKAFAYLETVCKDVYEPTCVHLGYYAAEYYYPKCKTVYKCEEDEGICGGEYCGYGYTCAVKECGYGDGYGDDYHGDGYGDDYHGDGYGDGYHGDGYHDDGYHGDGYHDDGYHGDGYHDDGYHGDGYGDGYHGDGYGYKDDSSAYSSSSSYADPYKAATDTKAYSTGHGVADADADAGSYAGYASSDSHARKGKAKTSTKAKSLYGVAKADADAANVPHYYGGYP